MKKWLLITGMILVTGISQAQFSKATLQATGLTCAMCSNAINKALQKVPFIASVQSDIKNSAFHIVFKQDTKVDIDALKNAVEDAGFSIGSLELTGNFSEVRIAKDKHVEIKGEQFHFLNTGDQVLSGEKTLKVVDKDFVTAKEFKKISGSTNLNCVQTGRASSCCVKDNVPANTRIYHVTI
jgi:copper chaperone CopZ